MMCSSSESSYIGNLMSYKHGSFSSDIWHFSAAAFE